MNDRHTVFNGMIYIAILVAGAYALLVLGLTVFQRNLMYHPDQTIPTPVSFGVPEMSAERVPTPDGFPLLTWWREPQSTDRPVLVYLHGNAGHLGDRADKVRPYLDAGYGVLLVTYRYNAGTGGDPSEHALMIDAHTAIDHLKSKGYDASQIVLYGESLGTGVVTRLAMTDRFRALVLEAPYSSIVDVAGAAYWYVPVRWLIRDNFDSTSIIDKIGTPLLIVHGLRDRVIAPRLAEKLFDAAKDPKEMIMIEDAHHTNLYDFGMGSRVLQFIESVAR